MNEKVDHSVFDIHLIVIGGRIRAVTHLLGTGCWQRTGCVRDGRTFEFYGSVVCRIVLVFRLPRICTESEDDSPRYSRIAVQMRAEVGGTDRVFVDAVDGEPFSTGDGHRAERLNVVLLFPSHNRRIVDKDLRQHFTLRIAGVGTSESDAHAHGSGGNLRRRLTEEREEIEDGGEERGAYIGDSP